jgi:hypothetical protein
MDMHNYNGTQNNYIFSLLSKNESRLIKSPVCLCVCLVDFHEIWFGGNAIQGDLNAIIFNPIASVILKF